MAIEYETVDHESLAWVNDIYTEVDFHPSRLEDEMVVIARLDGRRAAIGRLVYLPDGSAELGGIVVLPEFRGKNISRAMIAHLIRCAGERPLYCLPFSKLEPLYASFGFERIKNDASVPQRLKEKLTYCAEHYDEDVLLMKRFKD